MLVVLELSLFGSWLLYLEFDNSHIILLKRWDGLIGEIWIEINDEGSFS